MLNPKKILIISYIDYPYFVGLSRRITGIAEVLIANGVKVNVLAPLARSKKVIVDNASREILVTRINLRKFGSGNKLGTKFVQWFLFNIVASFRVLRFSIRNRCLIQYQSIYSAVPALTSKLLLKTPIIGDDVVLVHPIIDTFVLKLTNLISTPSIKTLSLAERYGASVLYVPNGVTQSVHKRPLSSLKPNILFVGALSFDQNFKAVQNIVKIASNLDKDGLDFSITIVGGPLRFVRNLFDQPVVKQRKVIFKGQVAFDELTELYNKSSIGLLPFFQDIPLVGGQRTKALEFISNGLLVISGPEGIKGIYGLNSDEHYLVANSLDEMCAILKDCIQNPDKYQNIAPKGASHVAGHHSWNKLTKDYVSFVQGFKCR